MEAAIKLPPEYEGLEGYAALGGLSTMGSPRGYTQPGAGYRGSCWQWLLRIMYHRQKGHCQQEGWRE
jgi:hypothetical protein